MNKNSIGIRKICFLIAALSIVAFPAITKADDNNETDEDENNSAYVITGVSPSTIENNAATNITITGTGFSTISQVGAQLGEWEDDEKDETDDIAPLTNVIVINDTTITATVPAGIEAEDEEDVTVFDNGVSPSTHYTFEEAFTVHPSMEVDDEDEDDNDVIEVDHSNSNKLKTYFSLTVKGKIIEKKKWLKVKVGNRQAKIVRITRSGRNTVIRTRFSYGKMATNLYNVKLTYKDRLKKQISRNGKKKYINRWDRGSLTYNNAFQVN